MKFKRNSLFKTSLFLLFIPIISLNSFPRIFANGSGGGYQCLEENFYGTPNEIETYVIRGAGEYLHAYADILMFLNRFEMEPIKGIDIAECRDILSSAVSHLDQAVETYRSLIEIAGTTPYNEMAVSKLRDFDFTSFMHINGYNGIIFKKVKHLLQVGDITGVYKLIYTRMNRIRSLLKAVNLDVCKNKMPAVKELWNLNILCSNTLMAGQFIANIFYSID